MGAGAVPSLTDQDWSGWTRAFVRAEKAFDIGLRRRLRERLAAKMPDFHAALAAVGWRQTIAWKQAAFFSNDLLKLAPEGSGLTLDRRPQVDEVLSQTPSLRSVP